MGDTATAARDPIFWLHHANVDRLWGAWLKRRGPDYLPKQSLWRDTSFLFYRPNGHPDYVTPAGLLNSEALGYRYEDYPPMPAALAMARGPMQQPSTPTVVVFAPPPPTTRIIASQAPPRNELTSEPLSVTLTPDPAGKRRVEGVLSPKAMAKPLTPGAALPTPDAGQTLQVVVEDIQFERSPGRFYEVYVNLPDPSEAQGPGSLYFGGSISFFALSSHRHRQAMNAPRMGKTATIDITDAVARLRAAGKLGDDIKVTFIERGAVPKPGVLAAPAGPAPKVTIGTIRLQHSGD